MTAPVKKEHSPTKYLEPNDSSLRVSGGIMMAPSSPEHRDHKESDGSSIPPFPKEHESGRYLEETTNKENKGNIESTHRAHGSNQQYPVDSVNQKAGITRPLPSPSEMATTSSETGRMDTQFNMAIHMNADYVVRVCSLDTCSSENLISYRTYKELGLEMRPYDGPDLAPLGELFRPIGRVKFDWHVCRRKVTYNTSFLVAGEDVKNAFFDVLLGKEEISKRVFFLKNGAVWSLENADTVRLGPA